MPERRVLLVPGILGRPSEVFIYRHSVGLDRYECHVAAAQHRQPTIYPHPYVHLLDAQSIISRLSLRMRYLARYHRRPTRQDVRAWQLTQLTARLQADLIHVHFLWNAHMALEAAAAHDVPLIVTAHGTDVNSALVDSEYRESLRKVFARADRILAVSDFIAERLEEVGCDPHKVHRHYLGGPIPAQPAKQGDAQQIRVLCIAAFRPVKGHRFLVEAFADAASRDNRLQLVLVGEGAERTAIESLVDEKNLRDRVTFTGSLSPDQVQQTLRESHLYAQHSLPHREIDAAGRPLFSEEALGISFVEAAGHALPLVAARSGGVSEICRHEINGFLVEPQDTAQMAARILELAEHPELRAKLGQAGRELVQAEFDQRQQLASLETIYDEVLSVSPTSTPLASVV